MVAINTTKGSYKPSLGKVYVYPGSIQCPHCYQGQTNVINRIIPGLWQCGKCRKVFKITKALSDACNRINRGTRDRN